MEKPKSEPSNTTLLERFKNLEHRFPAKTFLRDDYDNYGVIYHNETDQSIMLKVNRYLHSKFCRITHDPPLRIPVKHDNPFSKAKIKAIVIKQEKKFNLIEFYEYAINRGFIWGYMSKNEYEKAQKPIKKRTIKPVIHKRQ